ncbi:unnamed protein product [Ranitomeya imitator]|uniref:Uncharacterized protein n=1 Tax=Ranitomeya imitator TaxID=111125 RepID=A0ABN9MBA4_9NEOB|nr:unnamed protein product [Ranitomeya imitator]
MISNKYAMDTILLNIDFLQTEIKKLELNIGEFENKIKTLITIEEWNIFKDKVDKEGTKLRNDLEEIKRRKWNRDLEDYETGQIYAWQKENTKPVWKKKGGPWNNQRGGNINNLTNNNITPYRAGHHHGETIKRKRRGGKRHQRSQKKIRKEQNTTSEISNIQEEGSELVINISSKTLTSSQVSILSKGLSFVPCAHTNWFDLQIDLEKFFRSIKLKEWFQDRNVENKIGCGEFNSKNMELKKKSEFIPPTSSTIIDAFERVVRSEVEGIRSEAKNVFRHPNVTKDEFEALLGLVHDDDIIIKPADKGGAVVIMDKSKTKIQFLDVSVTQTKGELITTLYVKETDKNNLLTYDSQHPRSMTFGWFRTQV